MDAVVLHVLNIISLMGLSGSVHRRIPGLGYNVDLIVTMDAASEVASTFFAEQEFLRGILETILKYGIFSLISLRNRPKL